MTSDIRNHPEEAPWPAAPHLERAARLLAACRRHGARLERLPEDARPACEDDAYEVQRLVADLLDEAAAC